MMSNTPVISIILPTYNGSKYIRTSIESCLNQTFPDFELIIVNDCSTDETASIIEEYAQRDTRIKIINNEHNKKLPLSLNTGFDKASGRYHTWTSDDNYYASDALQIMIDKLRADNSVDLVYADYFLIDDKNKITGSKKFNNIYDGFTNWLGCGACFLYKKEIYYYNKGYDPSAFLIEDYDFFIRAFLNFNFEYLPTPALYYYRQHQQSLTTLHSNATGDLQKIMVERLMESLIKKLPKNQAAFLYRKYAIYYAVQKNNSSMYRFYLNKLWALSKKQSFITLLYVPAVKLIKTITVSFNGIYGLIKGE